ncbi:MAG: prepilin-type N-terminal cleavage/methylation domain-containing protein [Gemmatimonadetes bacterium]|nr:prepilin-type N-terminal cleavage/methylation domain-containing protein [Gemmatimonadota bacterium]
MNRRAGPGGLSLVELMVAIVIAGVATVAATGLLIMIARGGTVAGDETELLDATAVARALLPAEARVLLPQDIRAIGSDSVALRAFRGLGVVCARGTKGPVVRHAGLRDPDPAKDSVLVATSVPERTVALLGVQATATPPCVAGPDESLFEVVTAPDSIQPGDVLLFFESGSYHLDAGAFRYRPAGGTRQPLSADVLDTDSSRFTLRLRVSHRGTEPLALEAHLVGRPRIAAAQGAALRRRDIASFFLHLGTPLDSLEDH